MVVRAIPDAIHHWLLTGIPSEDVDALLQDGREVRFLPGEIIFHEGEPADGLYLITAGWVRVSAAGEPGETLLAFIGPDDVLGEMGVLDGLPRSATATATSLCSTYFVPAEAVLDVLERSNAVCVRLVVLLCSRLRVANGRLGEMAGSVPSEPEASLAE